MKHDPQRTESESTIFKDNVNVFYRRLTPNIEISLLRKIDAILTAGLTFFKRKFFEKYMQDNMESLLKKLNFNDPEKLE